MKLRTELEPTSFSQRIEAGDQLFLIGSCFTEHIGQWLSDCWLPVCCNPWGVLFNPASIARNLKRMQSPTAYNPPIVRNGNLYCSFDHHGSFSAPDIDAVLKKIAETEEKARLAFGQARHILVTWGTVWVFEYNGEVVANCHKLPASLFSRRRMTATEIVEDWIPLLLSNPDKHFVFNVSPIRHLADGLHGNELSKATLLLAIDELQTMFPEQVDYLPTYELLIDDLRDYRFYADDLVHPSSLAIQAVKELFVSGAAAPSLQAYLKEAEPIVKAFQHRPSDPDSEAHRQFLQQAQQKKEALLKSLKARTSAT